MYETCSKNTRTTPVDKLFYTNEIEMIFLTTITRIVIIPNESRLRRSFNVRYTV